jgi:hypothetical protein
MLCSQDSEEGKTQMDNCKDFSVITLNDSSVHDIISKVQQNDILEVGFTILYR